MGIMVLLLMKEMLMPNSLLDFYSFAGRYAVQLLSEGHEITEIELRSHYYAYCKHPDDYSWLPDLEAPVSPHKED